MKGESKPLSSRGSDAISTRAGLDARSSASRFDAEEHRTGPRPIEPRRPSRLPPADVKPGSRTVDGRPISSRPAKNRPVSARPSAAAATGAGGPSSRSVPRLLKSKDEIAAAPIDHRAGFLLAHIDGTTTVQGLVDIAGMAENEVHEILERLRRLGIVAVR